MSNKVFYAVISGFCLMAMFSCSRQEQVNLDQRVEAGIEEGFNVLVTELEKFVKQTNPVILSASLDLIGKNEMEPFAFLKQLGADRVFEKRLTALSNQARELSYFEDTERMEALYKRVADQALQNRLIVFRAVAPSGTPCYDAWENSMIMATASLAICLGGSGFTGSPYCLGIYAILVIAIDEVYDNCMAQYE